MKRFLIFLLICMFCFTSCASSKGEKGGIEKNGSRIYASWKVDEMTVDDALFGFFQAPTVAERIAYLDVLKDRYFPIKAVELADAFDDKEVIRKRIIAILTKNGHLPIKVRLTQEINPRFRDSFFYNRFKNLFKLDPASNLPINLIVDLKYKLSKEIGTATGSNWRTITVIYEYTNIDGTITIKLGESHQKILNIHEKAGGNITLPQMYGRFFRPSVDPGSPYTQVGDLVQEYLLSKRQKLALK